MTFAIPGAAYDRFMGRYSARLAPLFADFVGIEPNMRVLDVGCGPGGLTTELASRVGTQNVAGIDPSTSFVEACRARLPNADIQSGAAEHLPWRDQEFDAALSQLVLSFVTDADQVAREMRRVVRERGRVAACMWLKGPALQISQVFWDSVATVDSAFQNRVSWSFGEPGEIATLWKRSGLRDVEETLLEVRVTYESFDALWAPIETAASGAIGTYMAAADTGRRAAIREACRARLGNPQQPFELSARACAARGRV